MDVIEAGTTRHSPREPRAGELFLSVVGRIANLALEADGLYEAFAEVVVPAVADWCLIDTEDQPGRLRRRNVRATTPDLERTLNDVRLSSHDDERLRRGDSVFVAEPACLAVPLLARGRIIGRVLFGHGPDRIFSSDELELAEEACRQVAVAAHNAQLIHDLRRSRDTRSDMLAIVSHELRNPLTSVRLVAELLEKGTARGEAVAPRLVTTLNRSVARMERLVADLLDSEKVESGHLSLRREPVPTEELLLELESVFGIPFANDGLELSISSDSSLSTIFCDRDRVVQALVNLLGNAQKFTPRGGKVRVVVTPDANGVRFEVTDTGPGIPSDQLAHVFERFWQGGRLTGQGAGLGLFIAKGIVEAHGGRIWVQSRVDFGTSFFVVLPAAEPPCAG